MQHRPLIVVGFGRLGRALARRAREVGWPVAGIRMRRPDARILVDAGLPPEWLHPLDAAFPRTALIALCVPDDGIAGCCRSLADRFRPGQVVGHCSGLHDHRVLEPARRAGAVIGSLHPLQTFAGEAPGATWTVAHAAVEGEAAAVAALEALGSALGLHCGRIEPGAKVLYHAAATLACNHLCGELAASPEATRQLLVDEETWFDGEVAGPVREVLHRGADLMAEAGMAADALAPLVRTTLENVQALGPERALTGPIVRGDLATVRAHLAALASHPEALELYRKSGRTTVALARRAGLSEEVAKSLDTLLADEPG